MNRIETQNNITNETIYNTTKTQNKAEKLCMMMGNSSLCHRRGKSFLRKRTRDEKKEKKKKMH